MYTLENGYRLRDCAWKKWSCVLINFYIYFLFCCSPLPKSVQKTEDDICIFVKDLDRSNKDYEASERHYKELLHSKGVNNIAEV